MVCIPLANEEVGLSGKAARDDEREERKANKIVSAMRLKKIKQDQSKDKSGRDSIQKLAKTDARYRSRKANEEVDQVDEAVDAAKLLSKKDVAVYGKKMSKVLRLTGEGNINGAMKINGHSS